MEENYKKKYENLIESLRRAKETKGGYTFKSVADEFVPELRESEDEKVRKALIDTFQYYSASKESPYLHSISKEQILAWLEKQCTKESKKTSIWKHWKDGIAGNGEGKLIYLIKNGNDYSLSSCLGFECDYVLLSDLDKLMSQEKQGEPIDKGEISDGYHTFNELYYYRMLYNAAFFNLLPKEWVHKSKRHHTGEECFGGGWFIVMAQLPTGQISNHYELKDWDLFNIQEKEIADEWDGHSPQEAAKRLHEFLLGNHSEKKQNIPDLISDLENYFATTTKEQQEKDWDEIKNWEKKYFNRDKYIEQKPNFCHHEIDLSNCSEEYRKAYYDGWNNCNQQHAQLEAEQKPAWSEEDENGLGDALWAVQQARSLAKDENEMGGLWYAERWLKSIKERYVWKPSDEQIESFEHFVRSVGESGYASPYSNNTRLLYSLLEQLKKLREK